MKVSPISIVSVVLTIASLWGCSAEHVTAVEDSEADQLILEGEPVPGDPFGVCDEAMMCSAPGAGCGGWNDLTECAADEATCDAARYQISCNHQCGTSADCPQPFSGDSTPVCHSGFCQLPCDTATCPNGYDCAAPIPGSGADGYYLPQVCMQTFGPEMAKWTPSAGN